MKQKRESVIEKKSSGLTRRGFIALGGLGAVAAASFGIFQLANREAEINKSELLKAELDRIREQLPVPGLVAAYVFNGNLEATAASGYRSKESDVLVTTDDLLHISVCTMAMTATLIAQLVERGILRWDTPLSAVFPDLEETFAIDYREMPIVHFLYHRSGLPGEQTPEPYNLIQSSYWNYSGDIVEQRLQLMRDVLSRPPVSAPGTAFNLSSLNYIFAGAIAERLLAMSWEDAIVKNLFEPLGMSSVGFGAPGTPGTLDQPLGHFGQLCTPIEPGPQADFPPIFGPAGRVHLSITDWAKFAILHLRGAQGEEGLLLNPASFASLQTDPLRQSYTLGWSYAYRDWANGYALAHAGSNGNWFASIWVVPRRNAAMLAVSNCGSDDGFSATDAAVGGMTEIFLS